MAERTETTEMTEPARPAFTALVVYRNPEYRFSFLYPEGWHERELETDGLTGVIYAPRPDDTDTNFSVEVREIGVEVAEDDLPELLAGALEGFRALPGVEITHEESYAIGTLIGLEIHAAYREGEARRVRWLRLLYRGTRQFRMIAQGEAGDFAYWEPMLAQMMRTFRFGDWWADMLGEEWVPSLANEADDEGENPPPGPLSTVRGDAKSG